MQLAPCFDWRERRRERDRVGGRIVGGVGIAAAGDAGGVAEFGGGIGVECDINRDRWITFSSSERI